MEKRHTNRYYPLYISIAKMAKKPAVALTLSFSLSNAHKLLIQYPVPHLPRVLVLILGSVSFNVPDTGCFQLVPLTQAAVPSARYSGIVLPVPRLLSVFRIMAAHILMNL